MTLDEIYSKILAFNDGIVNTDAMFDLEDTRNANAASLISVLSDVRFQSQNISPLSAHTAPVEPTSTVTSVARYLSAPILLPRLHGRAAGFGRCFRHSNAPKYPYERSSPEQAELWIRRSKIPDRNILPFVQSTRSGTKYVLPLPAGLPCSRRTMVFRHCRFSDGANTPDSNNPCAAIILTCVLRRSVQRYGQKAYPLAFISPVRSRSPFSFHPLTSA